MSEILSAYATHVLLQPQEGDPHGLCAPGAPFAAGGMVNVLGKFEPHWMVGWVCGPSSHYEGDIAVSWVMRDGAMDFGQLPPAGLKLRLVWDGKIVPEGCDRAARALDMHRTGGTVFAPGMQIQHYARFFEACEALGTLIFLDETGRRLTEEKSDAE